MAHPLSTTDIGNACKVIADAAESMRYLDRQPQSRRVAIAVTITGRFLHGGDDTHAGGIHRSWKSDEHPRDQPAHVGLAPTAEHFLPLAYLAGLCEHAGEAAETLTEGGALGSITMTSYLLNCKDLRRSAASPRPAAGLPDPFTVPPEQTNT